MSSVLITSPLVELRGQHKKWLKWLLALVIIVSLGGVGSYGYWYYRTHRFDSLISSQAKRHNLEAPLVKSVIYAESYFDAGAESSAGARGLMQVTTIAVKEWSQNKGYNDERTALQKEFARQIRARDLKLERITFDPEVNTAIGCWYLSLLLNKYQSQPKKLQLAMALAGYNAGPSNAERWLVETKTGAAAPAAKTAEEFIARIDYPATREYVKKILVHYDSDK